MLKDILIFVCGVYFGQEYGNTITSVRLVSSAAYKSFTESKFYNQLKDDWKKEK